MFVVLTRRHYNKTLLFMLSILLHWQENATSMFDTIHQHLAAFDEYSAENCEPNRQPTHTSKWSLPSLFAQKIATNQLLPLGFTSMENPPNPNRWVQNYPWTGRGDLPACNKVNPFWNVFHGCGRSFHIECVLPNIRDCPICKDTLLSHVEHLRKNSKRCCVCYGSSWRRPRQRWWNRAAIDKENDVDDDLDEGETEIEINENFANNLNAKISLWQSLPLL